MHRHHQVGRVYGSSFPSLIFSFLCRYNNQTYRIDGIDWDKNPLVEFEKRTEKMTLVKYYADKYQKTLRDLKQPLIISNPPLKEQRMGGNTGPLFLVPELCFMTGLSEEQRANFRLMADLGKITRQGPEERSKALKKFSNRLQTNPDIKQELSGWNLAFSKELVEVNFTSLKSSSIVLILNSFSSEAGSWTRSRSWAVAAARPPTSWTTLTGAAPSGSGARSPSSPAASGPSSTTPSK